LRVLQYFALKFYRTSQSKKNVTTTPLHANTTRRIAPKYHSKDWQSFWDWGILIALIKLKKKKSFSFL
jgi:hypothetical protein